MAAREATVLTAKLAEQAGRYNDMAEAMKSVALMHMELTIEEGNLLLLAYANMIASRQASSINLQSIEHHEDEAGYQHNADEYFRKVEKELSQICDEFSSILIEHVIPSCNSHEDRVYYYKMIADTYSFRAGDDRILAAKNSLFTYQLAMTIAELELRGSNPIRLALALNLAVMHYIMFNSPESAFEIADNALDKGLETFLNEESAESSLEIMNILKNHLFLWHFRIMENEAEARTGANNDGVVDGAGVVSEYVHG